MIRSLLLCCLTLALFLCSPLTSNAQYSSKGTDFWFGFPQNQGSVFIAQPRVYISADLPATGTINIPGNGFTQNFSLSANSSTMIAIPLPSSPEVTQSQTVTNQGVHIVSDNPVTVYTVSERSATTDGSLVLPTNVLGDYYIASIFLQDGLPYPSEVLVIAAENNTQIEIIPSVVTTLGSPAGVPIPVTLNQGECYKINADGDLTGTVVKAAPGSECKNFAVYVADQCTRVPDPCYYCDVIYEQATPVKSWGKNYITSPLFSTNDSYYRVVARDNNTTLNVDGVIVTLNSGQFYDTTMANAASIIADKPISVCQLAKGATCQTTGQGDPFMIQLSPNEQFIGRIVFDAVITGNIPSPYINVVTATSNNNNIILDGALQPPGNFTPVASNPAFSYAQIPLTPGNHVLESPGGQFSCTIYGFGNNDSYGMLAGANFLDLSTDIYAIIDNDTTAISLLTDTMNCGDSLFVYLTGDTAISNIEWNMNGTLIQGDSASIIFSGAGTYYFWVAYDDPNNFCSQTRDTLFFQLEVTSPLNSSIPPDTLLCIGDSAFISVQDTGANYIWSTGETTQGIWLSQAGTYTVEVEYYGCRLYDTIVVNVLDLSFDIGNDTIICPTMPTVLAPNLPTGSYLWNDGSTADTLVIYNPGIYSVTVTSAHCSASDSLEAVSVDIPEVELGNDTTLCVGDSITIVATAGFDSYLWNTSDITESLLITQSGQYYVDAQFCGATKSDTINVEFIDTDNFTVPNVFTPNGDGVNDTYFINFSNPEFITQFSFEVFNRWGMRIYETNDPTFQWDGTYGDNNVAEGTYFYLMKMNSQCSGERESRTTLNINR